uniref:Transposon Ty3-I Gag-Pol polyprotein n=1 Tax=Cajanus cajan TaxID=3821 RepID=A0A151RFF1_CAJCA|nr:Transposon Ty3-I Gag-Pol polyprotein [Cajanus cajan]
MLVGEVEHWWRVTHHMLTARGVVVDWECFRRMFLEKYFLESIFEVWKCKKFAEGLKHELKRVVVPMAITEFPALVEKAKVVERLKGGNRVVKTVERPAGSKKGGNQRKPYDRPQPQQGGSVIMQPSNSARGGRHGEGATLRCYRCAGPYFVKDCPHTESRCFKCHHMAGRVFALTGAEASTSSDLVKGKGRVAGKDVMILFDSAEYVAACLTCQKAKVEHQKPSGLMQQMEIPEWKWDSITMDFIVGLPRSTKNSDAIWVIADRLTKCVHFLPVNIKWSLVKLTQLYVREIVRLHGQLRKYVHDPGHVVELDDVQVKENLTFEKLPVVVVDHKLKELRGKSIALVKVLWDAATGEATWEVEQQCRVRYPFLFPSKSVYGDKNSYCWGGCETPFFLFSPRLHILTHSHLHSLLHPCS